MLRKWALELGGRSAAGPAGDGSAWAQGCLKGPEATKSSVVRAHAYDSHCSGIKVFFIRGRRPFPFQEASSQDQRHRKLIGRVLISQTLNQEVLSQGANIKLRGR